MTKTYNDIEAVTRLLEEKERDLELAARIGQTLLSKNKELNGRGELLEDQLTHANEKINQLKHDLSMKDELLRFYCQDLQDESSGDTTPSEGIAGLSKINIEMLQRKVGTLEEENLNLRLETAQLRSATENYEDKEKKLVEDCLEQLAEVNQQVETFAGELRIKSEESARQKEEITGLLAQVADLHKRVRQLTIENMDLAEKLQASQESQRQLTKELSIQHDKYDELFEMLEQAQDELRGHRSRNNPRATRHRYLSAALPTATGAMDSLASELQNSLQQEESEEKEKRAQSWKVFETARAARKAASKSSRDSSVRMSTSASSSLKDPFSQNPSNVPSDSESFNSDGYSADMDSIYGSNSELGRPGIPGSNDLESALRRLAVRRANDLNERDYHEAHRERETRSEGMSPFRVCDTPDSTASPASGYSYLGFGQQQSASHFKIPDKLQIVKPLEGSVTLRHWQRLAQPHLGGLFEQREGVQVRGERKLDLEGEVYTLSDFEEDDDVPECPSRRMADSSTIYTFTNSMVSCPSDLGLGLSRSPSMGSMHSSGTSTPRMTSTPKSRSSTSSTYTMSLGLAAILEGREGGGTTRSLMRPVASCPIMPEDTSSQASSATGISTPVSSSGQGSLPSSSSVAAGLGSGLFGKLMSTGYSLLWNKSDTVESSADSLIEAASLSAKSQLSAEGSKPQQKPTTDQILPKGGSTGVLGAIATFRKNGIL
ncbi:hypothetical protein BaRGS_00006432 [Batillaria attramentaria]|uniref:Trafficking kinesin-binding protein milt n=1 Tax=Batillaria attramentaria TaxID=370345 RepID=A0ABD0LTZ7_9CAEN